MQSKIYISGAISTDMQNYEEKFYKAELKLKSQFDEVVNPVKYTKREFIFPEKIDYDILMNYCLKILKDCTHIYMLSDWNKSKGAMMELEKAKELNLIILAEE